MSYFVGRSFAAIESIVDRVCCRANKHFFHHPYNNKMELSEGSGCVDVHSLNSLNYDLASLHSNARRV